MTVSELSDSNYCVSVQLNMRAMSVLFHRIYKGNKYEFSIFQHYQPSATKLKHRPICFELASPAWPSPESCHCIWSPHDLWSGQKLVNISHYSACTKLLTAAHPWLKITRTGNFTALPTQSYLSLGLMERNTKTVLFQVNTEHKQRQMDSNLQDKNRIIKLWYTASWLRD